MNMKKVFAISLLFIALCSIGMVCAASVNNPEGFTINKDLAQNNQNGTFFGVPCEYSVVVSENGTDNITITDIVPSKAIDLVPQGNTVMKNISNKTGLFEQKDNGRCVYIYQDVNNIIQIEAPNEKLIEEVIGK
ncbi:MAG: hypothetical protein E7Z81_05875 [Methanobrevibacter sp.]|uniref:hypothetical protein n=1 Tax=Methanobrevibacter sp. TaxID=66852 RepID=UPI0025EB6AB3|nr:hypothetical protein [Methanobrevibacter sp.]MBE6497788.1 hypothetical protein [Methanobrevibacter sp.]